MLRVPSVPPFHPFLQVPLEASRGVAVRLNYKKATLKKEKKNERYRNRFINLKYKVERFFSVKSFESFDKVIL